MIFALNRDETLIQIIPRERVKEAVRTEVVRGASVLDVIIEGELPVDALYLAHKDDLNEDEIHSYRVERIEKADAYSHITAIQSAYDELKADGVVRDLRPVNRGVAQLSDEVLDGSRWQTGVVATSRTVSGSFYYLSRLEALRRMMEAGVEAVFREVWDGSTIVGRYVDWRDMVGENRGKRFVYGDGLLRVKKEEERAEIYTALIGRGKGEALADEQGDPTGSYGRRITFDGVVWSVAAGDPVDKPLGQDYVELVDRTAVYGFAGNRPRIGIVEFSEEEDPEELLRQTYYKLVELSRPRVTYTADVRDVGDTGLGDVVTVIRADWGLAYQTRIYKRRVNLLNPVQVQIELGDRIENYTVSRLESVQRQVAELEQTSLTTVEQLIGMMGDAYWGEDGYTYDFRVGNEYGLPAGIYSFDKPVDMNPGKFVYLGAGRLVISNEKNPDGSWKLTTILDGSGLGTGIVGAEQIKAGAIEADHISAGAITADKISVTETETLMGRLGSLGNQLSGLDADLDDLDGVVSGYVTRTAALENGMLTLEEDLKEYSDLTADEMRKKAKENGQNVWPVTSAEWQDIEIAGMFQWEEFVLPEWIEADDVLTASIELRHSVASVAVGMMMEFRNASGVVLVSEASSNAVYGNGGAMKLAVTGTVPVGAVSLVLSLELSNPMALVEAEGRYLKLEFGEVATEWRPSLMSLHLAETEVRASIGVVNGALQTKVERAEWESERDDILAQLTGYAPKSELEAIAALQASVLQTQEQWGVVISQIQTQTESHEVTIQDVLNYMTFGVEGLTLGKTTSSKKIRIDNEQIGFYDGNMTDPVAYISGQMMWIARAVFFQSAQLGNHLFSAFGESATYTAVQYAG